MSVNEERSGRRPTIADVAAHAGVSDSTVSQVLTGRRPVAAATAARVRDSIQALGFRPNALARALRTQTSHTIAFIIPNIAHVLYPTVARGVGDVLKPLGYHIAIYETDDHPALASEVIQSAADRAVDGAILFGFVAAEADTLVLADHSVPFVNGGLNEDVELAWNTVRSDQYTGMKTLTSKAAALSSGPIAFIGGHFGVGPANLRERAFRETMAHLQRPVDESLIARSDYSFSGGRAGMEEILSRGVTPRSVVCSNDLIAMGAMSWAKECGLSVPEQVTFSGYDNIEACAIVEPSLTSVETDLQEQGRACARLLLELINETAGVAPTHILIPTRAVHRQSTNEHRLALVQPTPDTTRAQNQR
jgi:LacI family transcriptional regulator